MLRQKLDYRWYKKNYKKIYEQHGEGYAIISRRKVVAMCATFGEAYKRATNENDLKLGQFIIQEVREHEIEPVTLFAVSIKGY